MSMTQIEVEKEVEREVEKEVEKGVKVLNSMLVKVNITQSLVSFTVLHVPPLNVHTHGEKILRILSFILLPFASLDPQNLRVIFLFISDIMMCFTFIFYLYVNNKIHELNHVFYFLILL